MACPGPITCSTWFRNRLRSEPLLSMTLHRDKPETLTGDSQVSRILKAAGVGGRGGGGNRQEEAAIFSVLSSLLREENVFLAY